MPCQVRWQAPLRCRPRQAPCTTRCGQPQLHRHWGPDPNRRPLERCGRRRRPLPAQQPGLRRQLQPLPRAAPQLRKPELTLSRTHARVPPMLSCQHNQPTCGRAALQVRAAEKVSPKSVPQSAFDKRAMRTSAGRMALYTLSRAIARRRLSCGNIPDLVTQQARKGKSMAGSRLTRRS